MFIVRMMRYDAKQVGTRHCPPKKFPSDLPSEKGSSTQSPTSATAFIIQLLFNPFLYSSRYLSCITLRNATPNFPLLFLCYQAPLFPQQKTPQKAKPCRSWPCNKTVTKKAPMVRNNACRTLELQMVLPLAMQFLHVFFQPKGLWKLAKASDPCNLKKHGDSSFRVVIYTQVWLDSQPCSHAMILMPSET